MTRVGIIAALKLEAAPLGRYAGFTIRVGGVGGLDVGDAVRELGGLGSGLVVSWGTAGALSPQLRAGDLVVPERVVTRNGGTLSPDARWREGFRRAVNGSWPVATGILIESDRILGSPHDKRRLGRDTDAGAVDMESGRIGEACAALNLPFLAIRAIVDELDDRLPRQVQENAFSAGSLRPGALLASLARHPGDWGSLVRLALRYRRARAALEAAARTLARYADSHPT